MEKKPLKQTVKETIDFVYELLSSNPQGYELKPKTIGFNASRVCSTLVKRGIISKRITTCKGKSGYCCIYKWEANLPPTKVLYGSIADELRDNQIANKQKKVLADTTVLPSVDTDAQSNPLGKFSDQELWDELKLRGAKIIDGKLKVVTVVELE